MSDLVERLRAAIDATEADARAAEHDEPSPWTAYGDVTESGVATADGGVITDGDGYNLRRTVADHIARHDPASVLRRCAADRRMVEMHAPPAPGYGCPTCWEGVEDGGPMDAPCPTLLALAEGYGVDET